MLVFSNCNVHCDEGYLIKHWTNLGLDLLMRPTEVQGSLKFWQFILLGAWIPVPHLMESIQKLSSLKRTNRTLTLALKISGVCMIHPLAIMNICTGFIGKPSNNFWDSSHERPNGKSPVITKFKKIHHLGTTNVCTRFNCSPSKSCWAISVRTRNISVVNTFFRAELLLPHYRNHR